MNGGDAEASAARERGRVLVDLSRYDEALPHLHRALAIHPSDPAAHCLVAAAQLGLDEPEAALAAAERAAAAAPEYEWPHRLRSLALSGLGRKRDARDAAVEACRLAPEEAWPHIVLANALQAAGDEAGALAAAEHAVALEPESADAHNQLGIVLLEHEREREAAAAFRTALSHDAEHTEALNNLAVAELRTGGRSTALQGFERAASLDPRASETRENLLAVGGRPRIWRRLAIACLVIAIAVAVLGGEPGAALFWLALAALFEGIRWFSLRRLNEPTRRLVEDDSRARRWDLRRWDWAWPTRLRPWWWLLIERLPPPVALGIHAALLALAAAAGSGAWTVLLTIALPFSIRRTYRWWRRTHPARGSWSRPG